MTAPEDWRDYSLDQKQILLSLLMQNIVRTANTVTDITMAQRRTKDIEEDDEAGRPRRSGRYYYEQNKIDERNDMFCDLLLYYIGAVREETVDRFWTSLRGTEQDEDITKRYNEYRETKIN